jgi:hypothetical protein
MRGILNDSGGRLSTHEKMLAAASLARINGDDGQDERKLLEAKIERLNHAAKAFAVQRWTSEQAAMRQILALRGE